MPVLAAEEWPFSTSGIPIDRTPIICVQVEKMDRRNLVRAVTGFIGLGIALVGVLHILGLQAKVTELQGKLADREVCPDVQVTCNCPQYEEGWDDAEFSRGCTPESFTYEELENMCEEIMFPEPNGIPGC
jgi:hypothetical protein